MGKNDIGDAGEILIEQRSEDARVQRLHKRGETGDVGKKCRNLAALPAEIDAIHPRHIDIGHHQINLAIRLQRRQGFNAVAGEQEADRPILDLLAELILPSSRARPVAVPRSGMTGMVLTYSVNSSEKP
jgi:hypothetical protein